MAAAEENNPFLPDNPVRKARATEVRLDDSTLSMGTNRRHQRVFWAHARQHRGLDTAGITAGRFRLSCRICNRLHGPRNGDRGVGW